MGLLKTSNVSMQHIAFLSLRDVTPWLRVTPVQGLDIITSMKGWLQVLVPSTVACSIWSEASKQVKLSYSAYASGLAPGCISYAYAYPSEGRQVDRVE